jgi:hypothetical protein
MGRANRERPLTTHRGLTRRHGNVCFEDAASLQSDRTGRTDTCAGIGFTIIATCCRYPKIGLARNPSRPFAYSSSTIARPTAIMSATAASVFWSGLLFVGYRLPRLSALPTTLPMPVVHHNAAIDSPTRRDGWRRVGGLAPRLKSQAWSQRQYQPRFVSRATTPCKGRRQVAQSDPARRQVCDYARAADPRPSAGRLWPYAAAFLVWQVSIALDSPESNNQGR